MGIFTINTWWVRYILSFFDVENFPISELEILGYAINLNKESSFNTFVQAKLSIKGITQLISFPVKIHFSDNLATAEGTFDVDRTLFDIKYKSQSYFPDIGDYFIYDDFTLIFSIEANKKE